MIRTSYFVWASVAPLGARPFRMHKTFTKKSGAPEMAGTTGAGPHAKTGAENKKPATVTCAGLVCGRKGTLGDPNRLRGLLVGATGVEPVTYAL